MLVTDAGTTDKRTVTMLPSSATIIDNGQANYTPEDNPHAEYHRVDDDIALLEWSSEDDEVDAIDYDDDEEEDQALHEDWEITERGELCPEHAIRYLNRVTQISPNSSIVYDSM